MKTSLALGWSSRTPIVEKIFPKSTRKKTSIKLLFAAIFLSYQNDCLCKFVKGRSRNEEVVSCARFHRNNEFTRKRICQDSILMKNSFQEYYAHTSTSPLYIPSHRFKSSSRFSKLSLHKMALERPSASAVELDRFSTKRCLTFFRIKSKVFPCEGSAWSLLYLMETELYFDKTVSVRTWSSNLKSYFWEAWIILATSDFVLPLTGTLSTPMISSPLCKVPSLDAGVLSNI